MRIGNGCGIHAGKKIEEMKIKAHPHRKISCEGFENW